VYKFLAVSLLLVGAASAQTLTFKAEAAALAVSTASDFEMTVRDTHCGIEEASFPHGNAEVFGRHPTAVSTLPMIAASVATAYVSYRLENSPSRIWRLAGHAAMLLGTEQHIAGVAIDGRLQLKQCN
jgi:hypothetical protein